MTLWDLRQAIETRTPVWAMVALYAVATGLVWYVLTRGGRKG
jgi:hypothetical protein